MVKVVIGNTSSRIVGHLPDEVHEDLDLVLSYTPPNAEFITSVKEGKWDGRFRLYKRYYGQSFDSGLLSFVLKILERHSIQYSKQDERQIPPQNLPGLKFTPPSGYEERDYQQFTIDRAIKRTRGMLKISTGGGKTLIVNELISRIKTVPFMFYVLTTDLMEQAYDTLSSTLNEPIGRIGGGKFDIQKINVCTIQTAVMAVNLNNKKFRISDYQYDEEDIWDKKMFQDEDKLENLRSLLKATKGIYMDEAHHASSKSCQDVVRASPNAYWKFGGSATPYREDGAEIVLQSLFGRKIVDISASYLIENGYLVEPNIFFEPIEHDVKFNSYNKIYANCVVHNEDFNNHIADTAEFLINNKLSTLILVQQINHGKILQSKIKDSILVTSKMSGKNRKKSIQALRDKKCMCMIATSLADEGLDIPSLNAVLLAGGGASATRVHQRIGRAIRKDKNNSKKKSIVIYYKHKVKYLNDHAIKASKIMKEEPRFKIFKSNGPDHIIREISEKVGIKCSQKTIFNI